MRVLETDQGGYEPGNTVVGNSDWGWTGLSLIKRRGML